ERSMASVARKTAPHRRRTPARRRPATVRVLVLVATRKGAWLYHGGPARREWQGHGPPFLGHVLHPPGPEPPDRRTLRAADGRGWRRRGPAISAPPSSGRGISAAAGGRPHGRPPSRGWRRASRAARSITPSGSPQDIRASRRRGMPGPRRRGCSAPRMAAST